MRLRDFALALMTLLIGFGAGYPWGQVAQYKDTVGLECKLGTTFQPMEAMK